MGDKLESKRLMQAAGVPVVPSWNSSPPASEFPVLVKATGGGGGKGMRLVQTPADLKGALESASREAAAAFGTIVYSSKNTFRAHATSNFRC
jgi:propionyl-CoA carboxylase alpha chain